MIRAAGLAIAQLSDPAIVRVLILSLAITLVVFAGLGFAADRLLAGADPCGVIGFDPCPLGGSESLVSAVLLTVAGIWLLFPAVAITIMSFFSERVVAAVEARHYPRALAGARHPGQPEMAWLGLRSGLRLFLYNLVALPFYLILLVTGIGPLILFVLVNAVALGRDLWELVAIRHLDPAARRRLLARTRAERFLLGLAVTALFMIPLANLLASVLGAAMATHLFHGRAR